LIQAGRARDSPATSLGPARDAQPENVDHRRCGHRHAASAWDALVGGAHPVSLAHLPTADRAAAPRPRRADRHLPLRLRRGHRPRRPLARPQHPPIRRPGRAAPRTPNAAARPRAGGGGRSPSPRRPPPPAFHPEPFDASEALDRVRDLRRAGFTFLAHRDEEGEVATLQATRIRAGHIETVLIHGEHDALVARCRDEPRAAVVWHQAGSTADVIAELLDLPTPGTHGAPTLARATPSELWIPQ